MRPGMFSPHELRLLDDVLRKAAGELGYSPGTGEYEDLAASLISLFETVKDPAELLALAVRSARLGRHL
jgi:hypothetical protein